jgi:hypothetical protein
MPDDGCPSGVRGTAARFRPVEARSFFRSSPVQQLGSECPSLVILENAIGQQGGQVGRVFPVFVLLAPVTRQAGGLIRLRLAKRRAVVFRGENAISSSGRTRKSRFCRFFFSGA